MLQLLRAHAAFLQWLISTGVVGIGLWSIQLLWYKASEKRLIQREQEAERRLVQREHKELERRTWQDLATSLLKLQYLAGTFRSAKAYIKANNDKSDTTTQAIMRSMAEQTHRNIYVYFLEWAAAATLLKLLPQDALTANLQAAMCKFRWANDAQLSEITAQDIEDLLRLIKLTNERAKI